MTSPPKLTRRQRTEAQRERDLVEIGLASSVANPNRR